jgi:hypothetical protein
MTASRANAPQDARSGIENAAGEGEADPGFAHGSAEALARKWPVAVRSFMTA